MTEEKRFRAAVERSWEAVQVIAKLFHERGYTILLPGKRIRANFEDREGYGDDYDLAVISPGTLRAYEIKWRDVDFTSALDFPYPTLFVDRVEKAEKVKGKIFAYLTINRLITHFASIRSETRDSWFISKRDDRVKGYSLDVYECPKSLAKFGQLTQIK